MKALAVVAMLVVSQLAAAEQAAIKCADSCHEQNCDQVDIRYGKFCGVGHGGCSGVTPCDSADACCKRHDECVESAGMLSANKCHKVFLTCLDKAMKKADGFSKACPYNTVIPTMKQGIQMAMMFTNLLGEGGGASGGQKARRGEL